MTEVDTGAADADIDTDAAMVLPLEPDNGCEAGPPQAPTRVPADFACASKRWPVRPRSCPELEDVDVIELALVDPRVSVDDSYFYDMDATCSIDNGGMPFGCRPHDSAPRAPRDISNGADNTLIEFLPFLDLATPGENAEDEIGDAIRVGKLAPLLRISGWNGTGWDDEVEVIFAASAGVEGAALDEFGTPVREWAAGDSLLVSNDFFSASEEPLYQPSAYVSEGYLVVQLGDAIPFRVDTASFRMEIDLSAGFIVGRLEDSPNGPVLADTILGGRWPLDKAVMGIEGLIGCMPQFALPAIERLQMAQDVPSDPAEDGMDFPCDALSIQLAFLRSIPVRWGPVAPLTNGPQLCPGGDM